MKIVIFDLDETLGYFTQFGILWDCLNKYLCKNNTNSNIILNQHIFNNILNLYPEFIRPNIINILKYLVHQKKTLICEKIMIYTNNQGPKEWVNYIIKYFENEINYSLFDQIISAFKQNGKIIEICRTTSSKTHKDLII
jgi:type II secretory pathway component GspD/PulD (secretin)